MPSAYQPGSCNIGSAERRLRYGFGALGFAVAGILVATVVSFEWPRWMLLTTAIPLFGGFIGVNQGREAFCVRFAMEEVYNVSERVGAHTDVPGSDSVRADRRRARQLTVRSAIAALVVTAVVYLLAPV